MKKIAFATFGLVTLCAATFAAPSSLRHSQPAKPTLTAVIPPPTCPPNDPNGCGIYE